MAATDWPDGLLTYILLIAISFACVVNLRRGDEGLKMDRKCQSIPTVIRCMQIHPVEIELKMPNMQMKMQLTVMTWYQCECGSVICVLRVQDSSAMSTEYQPSATRIQ